MPQYGFQCRINSDYRGIELKIISPVLLEMSIDFAKAHHPTLKTYEEFLEYMGKEDESVKRKFFSQIQFAQKERERLREKDRRSREKKKAALAALPPQPKKKPGPKGPWKHKRLLPVENQNTPDSDNSA